VTEAAAESANEAQELVFLHTAAVHVQTFDPLLRQLRPQVRARHVVREDLLVAIQSDGVDATSVRTSVADAVANLEATPGSVVLCTCSTIGGLAEAAETSTAAQVIRVDRAMAERAVALGPSIVVAAAIATTLAPTEALILEAASRASVSVRVGRLLVENAWPLFEQGDFNAYLECIAKALMSVDECDVVVLAQASMAGAAELCRQLTMPVLSSPRLGLESALAAMDASRSRIK
jgi:hypothetical protein